MPEPPLPAASRRGRTRTAACGRPWASTACPPWLSMTGPSSDGMITSEVAGVIGVASEVPALERQVCPRSSERA